MTMCRDYFGSVGMVFVLKHVTYFLFLCDSVKKHIPEVLQPYKQLRVASQKNITTYSKVNNV